MADVKEKINLLDVIPFRSENITAEKGSDGTVTIAFPRFKYEWMRRFLLPKGMSADIHVRLEDHGTAVWELIDGKRTVRRIIEELAEHFNYEENYESRITAYITQADLKMKCTLKVKHELLGCTSFKIGRSF